MLAEQQRKPRHPAARLLYSHSSGAAGPGPRKMTPRLGMQELRHEARRETGATARAPERSNPREAVMPMYYTSRKPGSSHPAVITRTAAIATPPTMSRSAPAPKPEPEPAVPAPLAARWAVGAGSVSADRLQERRTAPRAAGGYVMGGLESVRRRIADELMMLERDCSQLAEFDHARVEMHGAVFNRLLGSFKAYAPLFAKIKSVYDRALDERLKAVACTKPKEVLLDAISGDGFDLNLQSIHDTFNHQTKADRAQLAKYKRETEFVLEQLVVKQAKLDELTTAEQEIKGQMSELDDWQHTLIQSLRSWEKGLQELHMQADTNDDSAWKKKQDITKTQDKISNGMSNIERKMGEGGDLDEKKSELQRLVNSILTFHKTIQVRAAEVRKTDRAVKEAKVKLAKMDSELIIQKEKAVDRNSVVTPLPDWEDASTSLEKIIKLDISKPRDSGPERQKAKYRPSADIITSMVDYIGKLQDNITEAKQDVLQEELAKLQAEGGEEELDVEDISAELHGKTKWLVCMGRGDSVPPYLRATGRVKNKHFSRQQVLAFLQDYWNAKEASARTRSQTTAEYLESYIRNLHGTGRIGVEWIYNIVYGLKVYSNDPDCETFNCILTGELPEDAHHGQRVMIDRLLVTMKKADKQNHGGRMWGTLDRTEFGAVLRQQFPLKSDEDLKALRRATVTDQPLPDIRYGTMLEKNPETGTQGKFLETLREQYISDVQQSYPQVESAIRKVTLEENERTQKVVKIEDHQTYPYLQLLKNVPFFRHCELSDDELKAIILEMDITEYHESDIIISEGSPAEHAFILEEGSAYATKERIARNLNCNYQVGDFFGELGLKQGDVRAASIIARAGPRGVCRCIRMTAAVFNKIRLGSNQNEALLHQRQMQYYMATKMASVGTRREDNRDNSSEGHSLVTSVKCIKEGLYLYDPEMPDKEVNRLTRLGIGVNPDLSTDDRAVSPGSPGRDGEDLRASGAMYEDDMMVSLATFMTNIRRTVIKRFAKPKQLTEAEKRAQFLRNISDTERERITQCFNELDDSGDGTLDQDEIEGLLTRIYGMEPSKKQMAQLMLEMDSDGNGVIDLDEFIAAMATVKEVRMAGDIFKWRQTFDRYDEDNSGELSTEELKKMTSELWDMGSHSLELMQFMIEEADVDGDGQIDWPEFCQMMQRMMDADEQKLEQKRQLIIISAQGADVNIAKQEAVQTAIDRGSGIAKIMKWDINLGVKDDPELLDALWQKADYDRSGTTTYGELQSAMLQAFPQLKQLANEKRGGSRIIMRAFKAADISNQKSLAASNPLANKVGASQGDRLISRHEFARFVVYIEFFANLWEHFAQLDENKDGKLSSEEFQRMFHEILPQKAQNTHKSAEELNAFLDEQFTLCDANGNGYCTFDEFTAWIASYHHETQGATTS